MGRKPICRPVVESRIVPPTMTTVPNRIAGVTCSPSSRMARPLEMKGLRLITADDTEAPTLSMATNRNSRPARVPTMPAAAK